MKTVYCYGDSNTWGFDPRGWPECRYEAQDRWCSLLEEETGCRVICDGFNGRRIPRHPAEYAALALALRDTVPNLLILLLGTNDILEGSPPEEAAADMEKLLRKLRQDFPGLPLLLLSPPQCSRGDPETYGALRQLTGLYQNLASEYCIGFLPPGDLDLSFDGIHLSVQGHRELRDLLVLSLQQQGFLN